MAILWVNLVIAYVASLFSRYLAKPALMEQVEFLKPNKVLTSIVIATFVLIAGLRKNIGDTFFYMHSYVVDPYTWDFVKKNKDMGFGLFQMLLKSISGDPQILVFTTALITNVLIIVTLYKYSRLFEISMYIYITSGLYIVSMNGIRQFLASAIVFAASKYLFAGNWKNYFIVILLASTIHESAFILIPLYFVARRKAWTAGTFAMLAVAVVLILGYGQLSSLLFSAISDTHYSEYKDFQEGGANIIRVAVSAVPLVFAFLGRHKLREIFPYSDYVVNMSLLNFIITAVATQNWIFARFTIYFGLYDIILLSWIVPLFVKRQRAFIYYSLLLFYFIYFFYENVVTLGIVYRSDYLKF